MVDPTDDPIELVAPKSEIWRERFEEERDRVRDALAARDLLDSVAHVEHVGSTAVPDLPAKDIVDLDIVVRDDAVSAVSRALEADLGGTRLENSTEWHPLFRRHGGDRFNDHVFAESGGKWKVSVATRDVLRARPDLREEYERLKRDLAAAGDDLTAYSVGKTEFIARAMDTARADEDLSFEFEVPTVEVPTEE